MKVSRAVALLAVLALLLAACGGGGGGAGNGSASGSKITIAIGSEPTSLDPQLKDDGGERAINDNIYETLMIRSPDGRQLEPGLAAAEPTHPGGKDDVWEFKLRPNIKFSNGEAFNADAVVTSVTRIIAPAFKSEQAGFFSTITGATKVDDLTVDIATKGPDPILPARMYWMKMVPAKASSDPSFASKPVGTGPYVLKEWVRGDHITLDPNPSYWGGKPSVSEVTYKFVAEGGTRLSGLLAGDYDLVTNLLPEDVERAPKSAHVTGLEHPMIILNARSGITADPRVRQALNYAVNKDEIVTGIFGGLAKPDACQILSPSFTGFNQSLQAYPYDKAKAQALLQQAGAAGKQIELVGETGRWLKDAETIQAVPHLHQLFQRSFAVAKEVRSQTQIGSASVSLAAAAVRCAQRVFEDLHETRVLFVGAGEMIELAALHFAAQHPGAMVVANRTLQRAEGLASRLSAHPMRLA